MGEGSSWAQVLQFPRRQNVFNPETTVAMGSAYDTAIASPLAYTAQCWQRAYQRNRDPAGRVLQFRRERSSRSGKNALTACKYWAQHDFVQALR